MGPNEEAPDSKRVAAGTSLTNFDSTCLFVAPSASEAASAAAMKSCRGHPTTRHRRNRLLATRFVVCCLHSCVTSCAFALDAPDGEHHHHHNGSRPARGPAADADRCVLIPAYRPHFKELARLVTGVRRLSRDIDSIRFFSRLLQASPSVTWATSNWKDQVAVPR